MIVAAAFCPHPPVLIPQIAQGASAELDDLRAACRAAITRITRSGAPVTVVGTGPRNEQFAPSACGSFAGYGVPLTVALGPSGTGVPVLPLSVSVGAWLLHDALGASASAIGVAVADACDLPDGDQALLVMGDGSARRSTAAPGYLDERAEPYDRAVAAALRSGDVIGLASDADGLLAAGAPVWQALAPRLSGRRWDAEMLYDRAPYGVGYVVAVWT